MVDSVNFHSNEIMAKMPKLANKQIGFRANDNNNLERTPKQDSVEISSEDKENHTLRNLGIGAVVATGLAVAGDFAFAKGKHVKKLFKQGEEAAQKEVKSLEDDFGRVAKEEENIASRGSMGQDIYDPFDPANKLDPLSPYYENTANKGVFGQDIYNPADPMNKMDISSPYYDGGLGSSNGYGSGFGGDGFGSSGFGY